MAKTRIQTPKAAYTFDYPPAVEFKEAQEQVFWSANEINVEKDVHDLLTNMTDAERHGVITTLKLFTLYELVAGDEYWGGRFKRMFPRPELRMMASTFAYFELGVHAPFYDKINKALGLDNDEFYTDYVDNPILAERMEFVEQMVCHEDDLISLAAFSLIEGAVLYSAFAFLKHFQANGKNKLLNVVSGINFSVRDENLHGEAGSWAFKQLLGERQEAGENVDVGALRLCIEQVATQLYSHEAAIVDMLFEQGDIEGVTPASMKEFVKSRINLCLNKLDLPDLFIVEDNPIGSWFYKDINMQKFGDFFVSVSSEYNRNWKESGFAWPRNTNN